MADQTKSIMQIMAEEDQRKYAPQVPPFNPETTVTADARYIAGRVIKHMWIIAVGLPFALGILYAIVHS